MGLDFDIAVELKGVAPWTGVAVMVNDRISTEEIKIILMIAHSLRLRLPP